MKYASNFLLGTFIMFISSAMAQPIAQAEDGDVTKAQFERAMKIASALAEHARELKKMELELTIRKGRAFYIEVMGGEKQTDAVEKWVGDTQFNFAVRVGFAKEMLQIIEAAENFPSILRYHDEFAVDLTGKTVRELFGRAVVVLSRNTAFLAQDKPSLPTLPQN